MIKKIFIYKMPFLALLFSFLLNSCGTTQQLKKGFKQDAKETSFFKGFVLYNPKTDTEIVNHNGNKYFTPASITKLFTFYTAYRTFKDSVKSLVYYKTTDSLIIKGTADPTLLYEFKNSKVLDFLKNETDSIYLLDETIAETPYGSGWSWGDYQYYYMPEKSLFPIYGNILKFEINEDSVVSYPTFFKSDVSVLDSIVINREINSNTFYIANTRKKTQKTPFITSNTLTAKLLGKAIGKTITVIPSKPYKFKTLYGLTYNEVYTQMLTVSDNFIAEQIMLQVGKEVADTYSVKAAIDYSLKNYLQGLPNPPRWVDGSGLSRYNLFSPNDMVYLLKRMHKEIPLQQLLNYFAVGGQKGTIKNWYSNNNNPFVYAKTGTLSNNHNLCGYLITKKGTLLIFSYMNNHYKISSSEIKKDMEKTLLKIFNRY